MADIPEHELEETRAALAPTLAATAAILPWVSKPREARFDPKLNERWIAAGKRLATAWSDRQCNDDTRPAIFALYAIALETADVNCLRLGEALAAAADRLEDNSPSPRLIAAITATIECLVEPEGLEHLAFGERAVHFAERLLACAAATKGDERSAVLDRLFVDEAGEQIQMMRDGLAALPPDAYILASEAQKLVQHAELLEIWGVMHQARQLHDTIIKYAANLDEPSARDSIDKQLTDLSTAIAAVDAGI